MCDFTPIEPAMTERSSSWDAERVSLTRPALFAEGV